MGAYNDDVLFIHIPKAAGISCKEYMQLHLEGLKWPKPPEFFLDLTPEEAKKKSAASIEESGLPIGHIPLRDIPRLTGREIESWKLILAVVRNPYAQQVSQWAFWRDRYALGQRHKHDLEAAQHPSIHTWLDRSGTPNVDFHLWYEERLAFDQDWAKNPRGDGNYTHFGGFYKFWVTDEYGGIPENVKILKLEDDLRTAFGGALEPHVDGELPPLHKANTGSHHDEYMGYFNHPDRDRVIQSLDIVREKFEWSFREGLYQPVEVEQ